MQVRSSIKVGIRGIGGEIGFTAVETLMAMRRRTFEGFKTATGGVVTALIRKQSARDLENNIGVDRFFQKLTYPGSLRQNTKSSYWYAGVFKPEFKVEFDRAVKGRLHIFGRDGRELVVDMVPVPDTNLNLDPLAKLDLLLDVTGVGLKKIDNKDQDPNLYAEYPKLTTVFSAPVKTVPKIPHHLNGMNSVEPAQLNATGSCSTHAGVDLIHFIRASIADRLNIRPQEVIIEGGLFDATHSLTPSDNKVLGYYQGAYLPQTTGFGSAASVVYPVPHIGNMQAATGRYYSYFEHKGIEANGVSIYSLSMTISVKKGEGEVTAELIRNGLFDAASDREGRKHIGVLNSDVFKLKDNKKTGIFTGISLTGMTPTTILPLGENIEVVRLAGTKVADGVEQEVYIVTVKNVAYDNRLGFTVDWLEEVNRIASKRLGGEIIPGFDHSVDVGASLAFINTSVGKELFSKALELTGGELLMVPKN